MIVIIVIYKKYVICPNIHVIKVSSANKLYNNKVISKQNNMNSGEIKNNQLNKNLLSNEEKAIMIYIRLPYLHVQIFKQSISFHY